MFNLDLLENARPMPEAVFFLFDFMDNAIWFLLISSVTYTRENKSMYKKAGYTT